MMRFLLFIKCRLRSVWKMAEFVNGLLFGITFAKKLNAAARKACLNFSTDEFRFQLAEKNDLDALADFFLKQPKKSYQYFKPHAFDKKTLLSLWKNPAFFQLLCKTSEGKVIGYFLIRFFINKQAFAGFLVDADCQGRGIAKKMCEIIFQTCWPCGFRTFATVSKENKRALAAYRSINNFNTLRELPDNYIYIEYIKNN